MSTWNARICLTMLVLTLSVAGMRADDATPTTWLNAEGKDGRWKSVTERLRADLQGLKLTEAQEKRWGLVLRDHCGKILTDLAAVRLGQQFPRGRI